MKIRSKKETEERKEKRNKVLKILKRVLDILMYSWAVILTICLMVGSCSKKSDGSKRQQLNHHNEVAQIQQLDEHYFVFDYNKLHNPFAYQSQVSNYFEFSYDWQWGTNVYYNLHLNCDVDVQGYAIHVDYFQWSFSYDNQSDYYEVDSVYGFSNDYSTSFKVYENGAMVNNYFYHLYDDVYYFSDYGGNGSSNNLKVVEDYEGGFLDYFTQKFYLYDTVYDFRLIYNINYYYWANTNRGNKFDDNLDIIYDAVFNSNTTYVINIDTGFFQSNNQIFNRIVLTYHSLSYHSGQNLYWQMDDGRIGSLTQTNGYGYFSSMSYVNTYANSSEDVYSRNIATVYDSDNDVAVKCLTNGCSWLNVAYQNLAFFDNVDTRSEYYNILINLNNYSYPQYNGDLLDVFGLFKTAFSNIVPFLNISVIPGFTIGMLLCMPLAVTLIVVIVRLVKK